MTQWEDDFHLYDDPTPYAPGPIDMLFVMVFMAYELTPRVVWRCLGIAALGGAALYLLCQPVAYVVASL